jgi:hypothetical protein
VKALLSLFAAIRPTKKNAVPNSAVQMHFLPNREYRLATSAKDSSPRSAEMAAEGVLISSRVLASFGSGLGHHRLTPDDPSTGPFRPSGRSTNLAAKAHSVAVG